VVPLVLAGYLRYLEGVDDEGNLFQQSPDPLLDELKGLPAKGVLKRKDVFGVDLYEDTLGKRVLEIYSNMKGVGNVRKELEAV
jgi:fructuronate reductase